MHTGTIARVLAIAALLASCTNTPSSAPSVVPGSSGSGQTAAAPATAGPEKTPASGPGGSAAPSSLDLLSDDFAGGSIDLGTALLYRFYAAVGDDRLPAAYAGSAADDPGSSTAALVAFDQLAPDAQANLLPFLVRPTDPASWYAAAPGGVALAKVRTAASACVNGWIKKPSDAPAKVLVWGQCGAGASDAAVEAQVDAAKADMEALWTPMTNLMGPPIGDQNVAGGNIPSSPEGSDGLIDIYMVNRNATVHGRDVTSGAEATTYDAFPFQGPARALTSSGFIVVNSNRNTGTKLKSTLAHEFFHVLEHAHNNQGIIYRPRGATSGWINPWFLEASAVWAQHQFVPEARDTEVYWRFKGDFVPTVKGLSDVSGDNEYASFMWPLFMEQEIGPWAIRDAWRAIEGKEGFQETQQAIDSILSFTDRFHDFAVRVFNTDLGPGKPIDPLFQALDPTFPTDQPGGSRAQYNVPIAADAGPKSFTVTLASLGSKYWDLVPDSNTKELTLDFVGLIPMDAVDVDVLLLQKGQWTRKHLNVEQEDQAFCNVDKAIVVISNHAQVPETKVAGGWTARGRSQACQVGSWSATLTGPKSGAGTYAGTGQIYCVATPNNGGPLLWTATGILLSNEISQISLMENPSGFDTVSVQTPGGIEGGLWFMQSNQPDTTAEVVGSSGASGALVSGRATYVDTQGKRYTMDVSVDCSDVSMPPP